MPSSWLLLRSNRLSGMRGRGFVNVGVPAKDVAGGMIISYAANF